MAEKIGEPAPIVPLARRSVSSSAASQPPWPHPSYRATSTCGTPDMKLSQLMGERPRPVVGLPSSATTMEAATLMDAEQVESIVVLDNGRRLVGVLSERDLALAIAHRGARLFRSPIGELASVRGTTASPDDGVRAVIRVMTERRARLI